MENKLKPFDKVLVRDNPNDCWSIDFYSYTSTLSQSDYIKMGITDISIVNAITDIPIVNKIKRYQCSGGDYYQIIKYSKKLDKYIGNSIEIPGALGQ